MQIKNKRKEICLFIFLSPHCDKNIDTPGPLMSCYLYLNQIYSLDFSSIFPLYSLLTRFIIIRGNVFMLKERILLLMFPNPDWHDSWVSGGRQCVGQSDEGCSLTSSEKAGHLEAHLKRLYTNTCILKNKQEELEAHTWMQCVGITGLTVMWWNNLHNWGAVVCGWMKAL